MSLAKLSNQGLEASVLGGLFLRPQLVAHVDLEVEDFYDPKHQSVFVALRNLDERGDAIDPQMVEVELRRMGKLESLGGLAFLLELVCHVPSPDNVDSYATELRAYRARRDLVEVLADALQAVRTSEDERAEDVIASVLRKVAAVRVGGVDPTEALGELMRREVDAIHRDLAALDRGEHVGGLPTGLAKLDALIGGLPRGVVTLVLGETGHGKSTLGMSFARASADQAGDEPLVLSYEDGGRSFAQRGLAQGSGVPTQVIRRRSFRPGEERKLDLAMRDAGIRRERIGKVRGMPVDELTALVRRRRAKGPSPGRRSTANLVIVDYLQAMPMPRAPHIRGVPEALAELAKRLEDLAAIEDIAVVVFSQVNDEPSTREKDHRPRLRDGAGGRDAAKGAKLVLGIYRPWMYDSSADPTAGEILVIKNNDGEVRRSASVYLDLATHTIRDAAPDATPAQPQLL